jgi:L-ascorbate metabolism protein UlaG (beta-lactamase superfamily)
LIVDPLLVYIHDFYRLVGGFEEKAEQVQETVCKKLVLDMHYKAQVQCVINYSAAKWGKKMTKAEARIYRLTQEQYEEVKLHFSFLDIA